MAGSCLIVTSLLQVCAVCVLCVPSSSFVVPQCHCPTLLTLWYTVHQIPWVNFSDISPGLAGPRFTAVTKRRVINCQCLGKLSLFLGQVQDLEIAVTTDTLADNYHNYYNYQLKLYYRIETFRSELSNYISPLL